MHFHWVSLMAYVLGRENKESFSSIIWKNNTLMYVTLNNKLAPTVKFEIKEASQ